MERDKELKAMDDVLNALKDLEPEAIGRVLEWARNRFGVIIPAEEKPVAPHVGAETGQKTIFGFNDLWKFESMGELFAKARPDTNPKRALVSATYLQVAEDNANLTAQHINSELKHLGHGIVNVTDAITNLIERKPSLMIQLRKSGRTRQARKKYKVTEEGINEVLRMLNEEVAQGE